MRDVFVLYHQRLELMLEQDDPVFPNWDQDAAAIERDYSSEDPALVAADLRVAGFALAARFDGVRGECWLRRGRRSDGASFTVDTFARYLLHDVDHHLWDVG